MALTTEDGSIVAGANSYVTRAEYIAYALTLGVTIGDDADADVELITGAQFIGAHEANLKGWRVTRDQSMSFPRENLIIDGWSWDSDEIARNVILCQMSVALDVNSGLDPYNPEVNRVKIKEVVSGAVEVGYSINGTAGKATKQTTSNALLNSLLNRSGLLSIPLVKA